MSAQQSQVSPSVKAPSDQGPVGFAFAMVFGALFTTLFSWCLAIGIELVGMHYFWKERGLLHSRDLVMEDLGYIADAPHSVIVPDTVSFARDLITKVAIPFERLGVVGFYERTTAAVLEAKTGPVAGGAKAGVSSVLKRAGAQSNHMLATVGVIAMYTAQDTALRLAIVVFAMPAFVLACLLGAVDGLVRRDLRKWGGGRESSFIYHHAKATTYLALGGGFSLYLAWPTGGFNPAYMVLVFTAVVAWSLSLTLSSFKKYL
jgi:integrating conjugative element membrane protein (TIGR03747 family)